MAEVVTGEAVVLDVPCARFPSRVLACALDVLIQGVLLFALLLLGYAAGGQHLDAAAGAAAGVILLVTVLIGYPVGWETLTRGGSPGKFALGLRVIGDDGSPERFRQALVRALAALVEIWSLFGLPVALVSSMVSERGKRLGDLFAGTFVIQQRLPSRRPAAGTLVLAPELAPWAAGLELSGLSGSLAETARRYLARLGELTPDARQQLGTQLAARVSAQVRPPPPAGTPAIVYLSAVLAERGRREQARLQAGQAPGAERAATARGGRTGAGEARMAGQPASGGEGFVPPA